MNETEETFSFEKTPEELFTRTGDELPDDHDAFIESADGHLPTGKRVLSDIPDWRLASSLTKLGNQINSAYPGRDKSKDGSIGDARHCPNENHTGNSDHCLNIIDGGKGVVAALDVTHDAINCDVEEIVEAIRGDKDSRVRYIIWNRRICNSAAIGSADPWEWRTYPGSDPHTGHAHFSVKHDKSKYDDTSDWKVGS